MFQWGTRTYVMGIINVTPDSFSGDGVAVGTGEKLVERAVEQAHRFVEQGADILDIGGESTRPGSKPVTADEEVSRLIPAIQAIRSEIGRCRHFCRYLSCDVAELALDAGANWVNDVWGLRMDPDMAG